jgi:hypothetical protein
MVKQKSRKDKFCLIVINLGGGFWWYSGEKERGEVPDSK